MHSTGAAIASLVVAAASVIGVTLAPSMTLAVLSVTVVIIGVPHGGLDHFTGRALLADRLPISWAWAFFPAYLGVALLVVASWFTFPLLTALAFFVISAWHFGLEDDRPPFRSVFADHVAALALGGMVIWIPMLTQAQQIRSILADIVPTSLSISAESIVATSQGIAWLLLPVAASVVFLQWWSGDRSGTFRNISFAVMFAVADVLISFGVYFCGWHSVRGLVRLGRDHAMSPLQLGAAAAPLSLGAIGLAMLGMWSWSSDQLAAEAFHRTLFIALSAMAVPHLVLHGPITGFALPAGCDRGMSAATGEPVS